MNNIEFSFGKQKTTTTKKGRPNFRVKSSEK